MHMTSITSYFVNSSSLKFFFLVKYYFVSLLSFNIKLIKN
jgi:hypothetical protein